MSEQRGRNETKPVAPEAPAPTSVEQVRVAATEHDELHKLMAYFETHGKALLIVTAAVILGFLGFEYFKRQRESAREEAASMLFTVNSVQDLDNMVLRYGATPVAPLALLKLAKAHFDAGNFDMASGKYDEFLQKHPQHPFAPAAVLGKLHCQEALGQIDQALAGFSAFIAEHPKHFLTAQAIFGKGRCLTVLGRAQEAKILYEDLLAQDRQGPWAMRAEEQIAILKRKLGEKPEEKPVLDASAKVDRPPSVTPAAVP